MRPFVAACLAAGLGMVGAGAVARDWRELGGSPDQSKYVVMKDITRSNVAQLQVAWTYPTGDERAYQFSPLIVDNVMYLLAKDNSLVAIDVVTRRELWIHAHLRGITYRGIHYWESRDRKDRRLLFTLEDTLQAIDARTGKSILDFGTKGVVDLRQGLGRDPASIRRVASATPGRVFENLLILGSATGEAYFSAPGHVRAYDVVSGALVWTFHTIPQPGEFGHDTWPRDAWKYAGGVNAWGEITLDTRRGIAFVPLGSPTYDYYGADRIGANLFSDCLVALDARTGKRLWHFQTVHHDLWDYDLTAAPQLLTVRRRGRSVDVVAQATKQGFVFVFDRETGEPVWPIEERPVPASDMPGEQAWPTQPFSTLPPSGRQRVEPDDLTPYLISEAERQAWRERLARARTGLFTPPSLQETAVIPGAVGGTNWGNTAADPRAGLLYVLSQDFPSFYKLKPQADRGAAGGRSPGSPPDPREIERGTAVYQERCAPCHGQDRSGTPAAPALTDAVAQMGFPQLRRIVLYGSGRMPPLEHLDDDQLRDLWSFLGGGGPRRAPELPANLPAGPVVASGGAPRPPPAPRAPFDPAQPYPDGVAGAPQRYFTDYGLGYPYLLAPPWSSIMVYDLNRGVIRWRRPLGQDREVAAAGGAGSGMPRGAQRQGMIVTSTGLVFSTARDGRFYAFDADTGEQLWSAELPMGSEGLPAVYSVRGRHYLVVNATTPLAWGLRSREEPRRPGQGAYVVFALPESAAPGTSPRRRTPTQSHGQPQDGS